MCFKEINCICGNLRSRDYMTLVSGFVNHSNLVNLVIKQIKKLVSGWFKGTRLELLKENREECQMGP